jgi:CTP:molybdopterin cytidylyltransferase MocA
MSRRPEDVGWKSKEDRAREASGFPLSAAGFRAACVILGAGAGRRFGGPKAIALLPDGRRFVDSIAVTAREAGLAPIVAVLPPGVESPPDAVAVVNPKPESEQIVSVRLGLAQLTNHPVSGAVVWPVDHPFVSLESVLAILDAAKRTGAPIVAPLCDGRRGHPVFFHRNVWRELATVADGGARAVVRSHGAEVESVGVDDRGVLRDINTRNDLATSG